MSDLSPEGKIRERKRGLQAGENTPKDIIHKIRPELNITISQPAIRSKTREVEDNLTLKSHIQNGMGYKNLSKASSMRQAE